MFPVLGLLLIRFGQQTQKRRERSDLLELLWSAEKSVLHILVLSLCLKLSHLHRREATSLSYVKSQVKLCFNICIV